MLSATTRKNNASLRSCSPFSATYFSRSFGRRRRLVITRSACACMESTCAGNRPQSERVALLLGEGRALVEQRIAQQRHPVRVIGIGRRSGRPVERVHGKFPSKDRKST